MLKPDILISDKQYQSLLAAEEMSREAGKGILLVLTIMWDAFDISYFCHKTKGGWYISEAAYTFAQRNGFDWGARFQVELKELSIAIGKMERRYLNDGWSYTVTPECRDSWTHLRYCGRSQRLAVSSVGNDTAIYHPCVNIQFRFWHDVIHCLLDIGFNAESEYRVAGYQVEQLTALGVSDEAILVFVADTIGATQYYTKHHEFIKDSHKFISDYVADPINAVAIKQV